jgi:hypothetical protein
MSSRIERTLIRILIGAALCVGILTAALAPSAALPAIAFGQPGLYRLEVALLAFYCFLLLITPAFSGLVRGRLPVEISTRGARFAEDAGHSAALDEVTIRRLEKTTDDLAQALADAQIEIGRLNEIIASDNTQREVDSKR